MKANEFLNSYLWIMLGAAALASVIAIWFRKRNRGDRASLAFFTCSQLDGRLDLILEFVLEKLSELLSVPFYCFYLYDRKNGQYVLRAVKRRSEDRIMLSPSYSGLVPYEKSGFHPSVILKKQDGPSSVSVVSMSGYRVLCIPIQEEKGFLLLAPLSKPLTSQQTAMFADVGDMINVSLECFMLEHHIESLHEYGNDDIAQEIVKKGD